VYILTLLFHRFSLSRHDLMLLLAWPLINSIIVCSALYYVMSVLDKPQLIILIYRVPLIIFSICAMFWALRKVSDTLFTDVFNHQLLHAVFTNLLLISIAIAVGKLFIPMLLTLDLVSTLQLSRLKLLTYFNLLLQVTIYTTVIHSWRLKRKAIELEMSLKQSEISLLRIQTNPHFLFNTLNLLYNEIPDRPELAQELIFELSDLLRGTMAISDKRRIPLNDEIELIQHYLTIQKARFTERLDMEVEVDESSRHFDIPPMLILPLVENVIKHALSKTNKNIRLTVKTQYSKGKLSIMVSNSWPEIDAPNFTPGSGHKNITDTLGLEYNNAKFSIGFSNKMVTALIAINYDFNGEEDV
jgi:two-component system LytT family sensor kinase